MKNIEFLRNVSIGQYVYKKTPVHLLHPGTKLVAMTILITGILIAPSIPVLSLILLELLCIIGIARVSARFVFRGMLPALPWLLFIGILQLLFLSSSPGDHILLQTPDILSFRLVVTAKKLYTVAVLFLRFFALMATFSLFSSTTTTSEISAGIEKVFSPVRKIGFPAHELALLVTIMFRFIPILAGEAERLVKAQAARGADLGTHRGGPVRRITALFPIFLPLFRNALVRAEELVEAMETKCYSGGSGRTTLVVYTFAFRDRAALLTCAVFSAVNILTGYTGIPGIPF